PHYRSSSNLLVLSSLLRPHPTSTLFPYTTLFRSIELHNTKNGIERDVPVETPHQIGVIQKILAKKRIQDWIINNRSKFQNDKQFNVNDTREKSNLTFHGLRHSYTRTNYEKNIHEGMNKKESRKDVARNLGHGRDSVTLTYL